MSEDKGGSKADTLVKVVLVFFISLLSFSVGTFVGKQVSDSDHRNLALEGVYNKGSRAVASVEEKDSEEETTEAPDKISEKEVESLTEEFVNKEKSREPAEAKEAAAEEDESKTEAAPSVAPAKVKEEGYKTYAHGKKEAAVETETEEPAKPADKTAEKHPAKPAGHAKAKTEAANESEDTPLKRESASAAPEAAVEDAPKPKKSKSEHAKVDGLKEVTEKVIEGKAPSDGKKEARKPQSVLPSVAATAVGKFAVQVASYADEAQAKEYSTTLKEKGFTTFYLSSNVKGKTWYRVLVGLFDNAKGAEEFKVQVAKDLGIDTPIVRKIVE